MNRNGQHFLPKTGEKQKKAGKQMKVNGFYVNQKLFSIKHNLNITLNHNTFLINFDFIQI